MFEYYNNAIRATAWAGDFLRAVNERPKICQWLFRIAIGRYAWNEYVGLWNSVLASGFNPTWEYDLENMGYHHDPSHVMLDYGECPAEIKREKD